MEKEIINRVAKSPLITIDLEELYEKGERIVFDLKENLHEGIILKEKEYRDFLKNHNWQAYNDKHVAICCSVDAIIPTWAYMLLSSKLEPFAQTIVYGNLNHLEEELFKKALSAFNPSEYADKKVVIKGCSKIDVPISIYVEITRLLRPYASSIMYGEPCSTVPIFKKRKSQ